MDKNPYQVLGVSENATEDEIRQAYRRLAKQYHPDLNPGDKTAAQKMNEINAAYDQIKNGTAQQTAGQGYGALKDAAAEAVIATLAPIQAEHKRIMADKAYIADVLKDGAERASAIAFKTLRKVYKKVGLYQG